MCKRCVLLLGCILILSFNLAYSQESLSAKDRELLDPVIAKAKAGRTYETHYAETVWEYEKKDGKTFIYSVVSRDQFGRYRCRQEFGTGEYSSEAKIDSWQEMICDGNVFVSIAEIPLSKKHQAIVGKSPFRAMIFDASEAAPVPEPLEIGDFTTNLQAALDSGSTVKMILNSSDIDEIRIEYEREDIYGEKGPVYSTVIDLSQSSPVAVLKEIHGKSGELYSRSTIKYKDMGNGKILPEFQTFEQLAGPIKLKRTHRLIEARFNDPDDFPEETFDIDLPAGTIVWDKRHATEYRLKSDQVINDKLDELAGKAKAEQAGRPELAPSNLLMAQLVRSSETEPLRVLPRNSSRWTFIVIANLVILGVFSAFVVYKKRTSSEQRV